jgi:hypothetical protein
VSFEPSSIVYSSVCTAMLVGETRWVYSTKLILSLQSINRSSYYDKVIDSLRRVDWYSVYGRHAIALSHKR